MMEEASETRKEKLSSNQQESAYGDEVSIAQLILDVGRQWKVVAATMALFVAVAWTYNYLSPKLYRYTLDLEIGQDLRSDLSKQANVILMPGNRSDPVGFETFGVVMSQLENGWIPQAIRRVMEQSKNMNKSAESYMLDVRVSNPDDSENRETLLVRLSTLASEQQGDEVLEILQDAGANLSAQHADFLRGILAEKRQRMEVLQKSLADVGQSVAEREERIQHLRDLVGGSDEGALAAAVELNVLLPERERMLEQKLQISDSLAALEGEAQILGLAIKEFEIAELNSEILARQLRMAAEVKSALSVLPTRVLSLASRGRRPVGVDQRLVVVLALALGTGAGVILALIVQAIRRERRYADVRNQ